MAIRKEVVTVNQELFRSGLVVLTWGNASAIDTRRQFVYIKPSGVPFGRLNVSKIVRVSIDGQYSGEYRPSVDLPAHLELYRGCSHIGAVIHTHSRYATAFAQARRPIPCFGTTHADYFRQAVPLVQNFTAAEISEDYEKNIGRKIISFFHEHDIDLMDVSAALVEGHGVFVWGRSLSQAYENAFVLEQVAQLAFRTLMLNRTQEELDVRLIQKHFDRKHGTSRYYGQH